MKFKLRCNLKQLQAASSLTQALTRDWMVLFKLVLGQGLYSQLTILDPFHGGCKDSDQVGLLPSPSPYMGLSFSTLAQCLLCAGDMAVTQTALLLSSWGLQSSGGDKSVLRQMTQSAWGLDRDPRVWGNTVRHLTGWNKVRLGFLVERDL